MSPWSEDAARIAASSINWRAGASRKSAARFSRIRLRADRDVLLNEILPKFFVVGDQSRDAGRPR